MKWSPNLALSGAAFSGTFLPTLDREILADSNAQFGNVHSHPFQVFPSGQKGFSEDGGSKDPREGTEMDEGMNEMDGDSGEA